MLMLLQRLIYDDQSGFNYDYMGSTEYEGGGNQIARLDCARDNNASGALAYKGVICRFITSEAVIRHATFSTVVAALSKGEIAFKERPKFYPDKPVDCPFNYPALLMTYPLNMLIFRVDEEERALKFLRKSKEAFIKGMGEWNDILVNEWITDAKGASFAHGVMGNPLPM